MLVTEAKKWQKSFDCACDYFLRLQKGINLFSDLKFLSMALRLLQPTTKMTQDV